MPCKVCDRAPLRASLPFLSNLVFYDLVAYCSRRLAALPELPTP